jgi:hypothetical protein
MFSGTGRLSEEVQKLPMQHAVNLQDLRTEFAVADAGANFHF